MRCYAVASLVLIGFSATLLYADSFLDTNGVFTTITFPGAAATGVASINNAGQIVGQFRSGVVDHGCLDSNGVFTVIDSPEPFYTTDPSGINDSGQIVGALNNLGVTHSFLYDNGVFTSFAAPGAPDHTSATAINNSGEIVGLFGDTSGHGFLDVNGVFTTIDFPGALNTQARGINNAGDAVRSGAVGVRARAIQESIVSTQIAITLYLPEWCVHDGRCAQCASRYNSHLRNKRFRSIVGVFAPVPEPGSALLLGPGLIAIRLRYKKASAARRSSGG
jgi:probable HAF family extracellular repeat protein